MALAVVVRAALPWAIARIIESQARSQVGLPVRVGDVDLWIARGAVAIEDLTVGRKPADPAAAEAEPDPATALLRLRRFFVDLEWLDLFSRRIHLRELAIDGPAIRVERDAEGRIDPLGPLPPSGEPEPEEPAAEPSEPWSFALDRLDLLELQLELVDLATQKTPVEFSLAGFGLSDVSVAGSDLGLGGIEIRSPELRVDRDFAFGAQPAGGAPSAPAGPPAPAPGAGASEPLAYRIERIGIADAAFSLRTGSGPIDVSIRLSAERVSARSGELFPIDLELGIGAGRLALRGELGLNPIAYRGHLSYADLALPPLGVAARPELAEWVRSCSASGDFDIDFRSTRAGDAAPGLRLSGATRIKDLLLADPKGEEVSVGWRELEIAAREVVVPLPVEGETGGPTRVSLERVRLVEPDVVYTLPASQLGALLRGGEAEPEGAAASAPPPAPAPEPAPGGAAPAPPVELVLDAFELVGGRAHFRDRTVSPPFEARVRDLALAVQGAGFPEPHAKSVRGSGIIPETASFSLDGGLEKGSGKLRFELERLALPAFDPYAAGAGYRLQRGDVSLQSAVRMRGARTETDNRILLHRLDVSSTDAGDFEKRFGMPLDLALALLRDPQGDIRLDVPVVADESGARADLATIVAGALRQALVGALSSPLKLVGAVLPVGGGAADASLAPLEAPPGVAGPTPAAEERLEPLAKLLASRPALAYRLAGRAGAADRPPLAEQILAERAASGEDWPEVEGSGFLARRRLAQALAARAKGKGAELSPGDEALLARTAAAVEVPAERLRDLARRRAEAVRDALVAGHGVDAARLVIAEPAAEGDPGVVVALAAAPAAAPASASVR